MANLADNQTELWQPFGVTDADFDAAPEHGGVRVVNVTPGADQSKDAGRRWLGVAMAALGALACAAAAVSWQAQYEMVLGIKNKTWVAALEAGIPDAGAIVFAALGIALALHGKRAVRPRALNIACVGISLLQNALAAGTGWRDLAIWIMPSAVYAVASDTLISVIRAWAIARVRNLGETLADEGTTWLTMAAGTMLWLLRLTLATRSTLAGFRAWVVADCPVAPGLRPGHVAELEAVRQEASQLAQLAAAERDRTVEQAAQEVSQAQEDLVRAETAEATVRDELKRARSDAAQERMELQQQMRQQAEDLHAELARARDAADQRVSQARAEAARERMELQQQMRQQAEDLRAELARARDAADQRVSQARAEAAEEREALRGQLQNFGETMAAALKETAQGRDGRSAQPRVRDADDREPTKRVRMIQLAGQRRDLSTIPLQDVASLASTVAAEIDYSPGTARRELMRHVRELQSIPDSPAKDDMEGDAQ
jgi:flagellar biosynthesis GTPase FlhF